MQAIDELARKMKNGAFLQAPFDLANRPSLGY